LLASCGVLVMAQMQLPPGTVDVPVPRRGDCAEQGPATYVYRFGQREPNDYFPNICRALGGATVHFNNPCEWAHGQAQLTTAHFTNMCKGATRVIHWHNTADEWGFVNKGRVQTFVASPDGLPWPNSINIISEKSVWFFPSGWLHGLMCITPEDEGGCEFTIIFASPQAAEPNGHNLATTVAQSPDEIAAKALGVDLKAYTDARPTFIKSAHSIHYSFKNMTAPIVTAVEPSVCEPKCPPVMETLAVPAAIHGPSVEVEVYPPVSEGCRLFTIRTSQFPFSRTMSQERAELSPGATRPMVWNTADAVIVVLRGSIVFGLEGGIIGKESHLAFTNETVVVGDVAYVPNARAYWFQEATGREEAEVITVLNVGEWKSIEMARSMQYMPQAVVAANLYLRKPLPATSHIAEMLTAESRKVAPVTVMERFILVASVGAIGAVVMIGTYLRRRRSSTCSSAHGPLLH